MATKKNGYWQPGFRSTEELLMTVNLNLIELIKLSAPKAKGKELNE